MNYDAVSFLQSLFGAPMPEAVIVPVVPRPAVPGDWPEPMRRWAADVPGDVLEGILAADLRLHTDRPEAVIVLDADGWPMGSIDPADVVPCPECNRLELWQSMAGNWHCQRCAPPRFKLHP